MYSDIVQFIRAYYQTEEYIPLHAPVFAGNEKKYLEHCIDTTFVSYVGEYVGKFEQMVCDYTGARYAVAIVNGTCALHLALRIAGVKPDDEVLTPSLTFVATANAIAHCKASPVFIDSAISTLGMSPEKLEAFIAMNCEMTSSGLRNNISGKYIRACVPVHVFGHPAKIDEIVNICEKYGITVIEDAAESIGSLFNGKHTGTFGKAGILSFNGNKIITTGGGGMIITDDAEFAKNARHLSTTAKIKHPWEFIHDEVGYNYRMTNLSAAVGCAQMENIALYLEKKRELAALYKAFFIEKGLNFFAEKPGCISNYWLNCLIMEDREERDALLKYTNEKGVMTRAAWRLMNKLEMYKNCYQDGLENAQWLEDRIVNLPSSVMLK